jgi:polyisoprenoid-binding protein YceI
MIAAGPANLPRRPLLDQPVALRYQAPMRPTPAIAIFLLAAACSVQGPEATMPAADAAWTLDPAGSRLSFVSVKAADVAEVHHFTSLAGTVAADGTATLEIPLSAVETNIDIRNERMRDILFQVTDHPTAQFTATIDLGTFQSLRVGDQVRVPLAGELSLHGMTAPIETMVSVTRAAPDRVMVATLDPIVVNAGSFNLLPGLAELQKLANLPSITPDVPVSFQLMFRAEA